MGVAGFPEVVTAIFPEKRPHRRSQNDNPAPLNRTTLMGTEAYA